MLPLNVREAGRLGGLSTRSRHDPRRITEPARLARWRKYLTAVDPDGILPPAERVARAEAARRAEMIRISALGVAARKRGARA